MQNISVLDQEKFTGHFCGVPFDALSKTLDKVVI